MNPEEDELEFDFEEEETAPVSVAQVAPGPPAQPQQPVYSDEDLDAFALQRMRERNLMPTQPAQAATPAAELTWDQEIAQNVRKEVEAEVTGKVMGQVQSAMAPTYIAQLIDQAKTKGINADEEQDIRAILTRMNPQQLAEAASSGQGAFLGSAAIGERVSKQRLSSPNPVAVGVSQTPQGSGTGKRSVALSKEQSARYKELVGLFGDTPAVKQSFLKEEGLV